MERPEPLTAALPVIVPESRPERELLRLARELADTEGLTVGAAVEVLHRLAVLEPHLVYVPEPEKLLLPVRL